MPESFFLIFSAIIGLFVGSFLNVVALRDNRRKTIVAGRSACMHCGHELAWYELLPLVSWLVQGGRCRSCRAKLSLQYPLGELVSMVSTAGLTWFCLSQGYSITSLVLAVAALWIWLVVAYTDILTQTVRIEYVVVAGFLGFASQALLSSSNASQLLLGIITGGGVIGGIIAIWYLVRRVWGMGDGDIWIAASLGAMLGWELTLVMLALAVFGGAIVGLLLIALKKVELQSTLPFGPFLIIGAYASLVWGWPLIEWYTKGIYGI